jgi:hypothetical protein
MNQMFAPAVPSQAGMRAALDAYVARINSGDRDGILACGLNIAESGIERCHIYA